MRLLITRPRLDAQSSRDKLMALGHEAIIAPLIEIQPLVDVKLPALPWQAILVTSGNGARAIGQHKDGAHLRDIPVLAVGDQSAARMRDQGFTNVVSANGDGEALARLACERLDPAKGPLLHVAGSVRASDLGQLIGPAFDLHRIVLYAALPVTELPSTMIEALNDGNLSGVLFYSPRTARIFAALIAQAGSKTSLSRLTAFCLSSEVARALPEQAFGSVKIAAEPKEDKLLMLLDAD